MRVPRDGHIGDLCDLVEPLCRIPAARIAMMEVFDGRIQRVLADSLPVRVIRYGDNVVGYAL